MSLRSLKNWIRDDGCLQTAIGPKWMQLHDTCLAIEPDGIIGRILGNILDGDYRLVFTLHNEKPNMWFLPLAGGHVTRVGKMFDEHWRVERYDNGQILAVPRSYKCYNISFIGPFWSWFSLQWNIKQLTEFVNPLVARNNEFYAK